VSAATDAVDRARVTDWLVEHTPPVEPPLTVELVAGGRSNLTFLVTDTAGRRLVLRRPPMSHVLATAHDMGREHRIIAALRASPVPVPDALGYCDDEAVNGRPFYVMGFVEGHVLRTAAEVEDVLDEAGRRAVADDLVEVLVRLHEVDVDAVGLGDLGRQEGYVERQLRRWHGQFHRSQDQEREAGVFRPAEVVDEVHALLSERVPAQQGVAVVHGDYRLDNTIVGEDGRVRAVLDWELCTLGDPLADVGTLLVYWADGSRRARMAATGLPGFPTRDELAAAYAARSTLDLSPLPYYVALGHWKLACIMEGVYVRYASGAMGDQQGAEGTQMLADSVVHRASLARDLLAVP
jgi:aminoglycoside phosphotransferase (APT) family kinase protein